MFGTLLYLSFLLFLVITGVSSKTNILHKYLKEQSCLGNISTVFFVSKESSIQEKILKFQQNDLPDFNN